MLVKDRMTRHPITIRESTSLYDALKIMRDNKIRRLPVLDKDGKLVFVSPDESVSNGSEVK